VDKKTCPDGLNPMLGILPIHHLFGKDALLILERVSFLGSGYNQAGRTILLGHGLDQ